MLAIERRNEILSIIQKNQSVIVSELSKQYDVTEETIRRDLDKLEKDGFVKKTYGGAVYKQNLNVDVPFAVRERANKEGKNVIAKKIFDIIDDGDSIMLDSSSTALAVARALKQKRNLTILTNSVEILLEFANLKNIKVISTGGALRDTSLSLVGQNAINMLKNFNADKAIISCKGIDQKKGITDSSEHEAEIKKTMIDSCKQVIVAADNTKFDQVSFVKVADFSAINIITTDSILNIKWQKFLGESGITLL